jgi:hypothetical protein
VLVIVVVACTGQILDASRRLGVNHATAARQAHPEPPSPGRPLFFVVEHGPVHGAKDRQLERMPVAIGTQRQILNEASEDLLVLVALADEFSDALEIVVARRRQDRARHAATEQDPAVRNDGLVELPPGLVDSRNGVSIGVQIWL